MNDLSHTEQQELLAREARIEAASVEIKRNFIIIGQELRAIHEHEPQPLWRQTHESFEAYCQQRWHLSLPRAYELMRAERIVRNLQQLDWTADDYAFAELDPPRYEAHVRPLSRLTPEHQREVWREVQATAPEGGVTQRYVRETMDRLYPRRVEFPPPPTERPYGMEESLGQIYGLVVTYLEAVEQKGGIKLVAQNWTQDRKQEYLRKVAEIDGKWTVFAGEVEEACRSVALAVVRGEPR
jgi:hypothetical protein